MSDVLEKLHHVVAPERVLTTFVDRVAYNADCWPRNLILSRGSVVERNLPAAIVQPETEAELIGVVEWANETQTPIIPFGAGSGVCGGTVVKNSKGVVVDMKRFKGRFEVDEDQMLLRAGAGMIGMNLEMELQRRGLTLGHFPSSLYCSSLGGYIAGRSAGQYSSLYGKMEDMVTSIRCVDGNANVIETVANPFADDAIDGDGPLLNQLLIGSEGTLGLIHEATLRITHQPGESWYRGYQFENVSEALSAIRVLMQTGTRPAVVRLYDAFDTIIAKRKAGKGGSNKLAETLAQWIPSDVSQEMESQYGELQKQILKRVLGSPLLLNTVVDALPSACMLVVGFEGDGPIAEAEAFDGFALLGRYGIDLGSEPGVHWKQHRMDVSYKQSAMYVAGSFVDTMEVSTTWANLERLYDAVRRAMADHVFVMAHFSHVYPEGSSIYFTFAGYGHNLEDTLARYEATWETALNAVHEAGGSVAHHHGVGLSKAGFTERDHVGGRPVFDQLKKTFDPNGILNPGKVWSDRKGVDAWR